jgi:hypothetical protein
MKKKRARNTARGFLFVFASVASANDLVRMEFDSFTSCCSCQLDVSSLILEDFARDYRESVGWI